MRIFRERVKKRQKRERGGREKRVRERESVKNRRNRKENINRGRKSTGERKR